MATGSHRDESIERSSNGEAPPANRGGSFTDLRISMGASTVSRYLYRGVSSLAQSFNGNRSADTNEPSVELRTLRTPDLGRGTRTTSASAELRESIFSAHSQIPEPLRFPMRALVPSDNHRRRVHRPEHDPPLSHPVTIVQPDHHRREVIQSERETVESTNEASTNQPRRMISLTRSSVEQMRRRSQRGWSKIPPGFDQSHTGPHPAVQPPLRFHHLWPTTNPRTRRMSSNAAESLGQFSEPHQNTFPTAAAVNTQDMAQEIAAIHGTESPVRTGGFSILQAVAGFFVFLNVWGTILSYGALLAFYGSQRYLGIPPTVLAVIGSTQPFLLYVFAPINIAIVSGVRFRIALHGGSVIFVVSVFIAPLSTTPWQLFLVHGLLSGGAMSMIFKSTMESLATTSGDAYNVVMAVAASGSTLSAVVFVCLIRAIHSTDYFDLAWALRSMGFISLGTLLAANLLLHPVTSRPWPRWREQPGSARQLCAALFRRPQAPFWFATTGVYLASSGVLLPFYSIVAFGIARQHLSGSAACLHLIAMVAATLPGFVLPSLLVHFYRWSSLDILAPSSIIAAIMVFFRMKAAMSPTLLALAIVYGFFAAALNGVDLPQVSRVRSRHSEGLDDDMMDSFATVKDSIVCLAMAVGFLTGPVIGSAFIGYDATGTGFLWAQGFSGITLFLGGIFFWLARAFSKSSQI